MHTTVARRSGVVRWLVGPALVAVVAVTLLIGGMAKSGGVAHGATGDNLRTITAATPACSVGTGVAFDGTHLILDCWGSNHLWRVSPADGSLIDTLTITGAGDLRAIAWDSTASKLWACNGSSSVVLVDTAAQTAAPAFASQGCVDGLAYDGTDNTLWSSGDAASSIQHFQTNGTLIQSFSLSGKLGGSGNSGIAVGGDNLYLANDGGSQIYQCTKDLTTCTLMSTFPRRLEDLECDNITFAPKGAIWSNDAYDRILNAWEIPAGTCNFGGSGGGQAAPTAPAMVRSATPTATVTPVVTATELAASTAAPVTATVAPPTATPPGGGTAGVITGPNTGSGPGDAQMRIGWLLLAVAMLSSGAVLSTAALRARRR